MIWCVDDDSAIRDIEVYTLNATGFEAKGFADGVSMLHALSEEKPQLIILDIMMPELDGVEVLKKLRAMPETQKIPVIMATAKGMEYDKIQSLDLGAMQVDNRVVTVDGETVALTYKEFELLHLFLSHIGVVFSREKLLNAVWGVDYYGETRTVDMHIKTLRKKLGKYGSLIKTVISVGYRMEASL